MDDSMLSFYIKQGQRYVKSMWKRSGIPGHYVCRYFYEYRVAEKLEQALDALTPFFVQEVYDAEEEDE